MSGITKMLLASTERLKGTWHAARDLVQGRYLLRDEGQVTSLLQCFEPRLYHEFAMSNDYGHWLDSGLLFQPLSSTIRQNSVSAT